VVPRSALRERLELVALGEESNRSTALGDVVVDLAILVDGGVGLLQDNEFLALVVVELLLAGNESLRVKVDVGRREASENDALITAAAVESSMRESLGSGDGEQAESLRDASGIRDEVRVAKVDFLSGAVDVESASIVIGEGLANKVLAGSNVDAGNVAVLDGRLEVLGVVGDVEDKLEALGDLRRRVVRVGGRSSRGSSSQGSEAESDDGSNHFEGEKVVRGFESECGVDDRRC